MAIKIKKAILHILRGDGPPSVFSHTELDIESETCETFVLKHVKKLINNPATRTALFKTDSAIYKLVGDYQNGTTYFKETSVLTAQKLEELMVRFKKLPPCDLLIAHVANKGTEYLAILKLGYQEVYAHRSKDADNQLTKYTALPFSSGKVEHACLIGLDGAAMPIHLIEKPEVLEGTNTLYFSELFLECESSPSKKEQAQLINEINNEFVQEYYENNPKITARIRTALVAEAEAEEGFVSIDNVAATVFTENEEEKTQYVSTLRDAGIVADLPLGERVVRSQFATQRIKGDNGIEIKFPAPLAADEDELEITPHPDGTVTVVIKRLRMV
ncbi:MAG: nucleoid-associated protein [Defluviitaleaceae bacterium]|nr:nucleoid-associated protein [Defluviitaleaceae bacterium]MCL2240001.1 nucleoid-associated protein [Defluviitaleaceae bacterium]